MIATPRYPDDEQPNQIEAIRFNSVPKPQENHPSEENSMAPTWPATKANTPVPILPTTAPQPIPAVVDQPVKPVDVSLFPEPVPMRKPSPAEILAAKKKSEVVEKEKKEKVRYFFTTLKQIRGDLGLTGPEVAAAIGISDGGYSRIELGYGISLILAMKIAEFFGKTVDEIWAINQENVPTKFED